MLRTPLRILLLALVVLLVLPATAPVRAEDQGTDDGRNFVQRTLARIRLGEGIQANQVTIFPLVLVDEPEPMAVIPNTKSEKLRISEPEFPSKRYNIEVMNGEAEPVLLLGGTVLEGGERDRLVERDVLLPPGQTVEVETLPAASSSEIRREPIPFTVSEVLAPPYLQEQAMFGASASLIPIFVSHFDEFRNEGDDRKSLIAINESGLLTQYCLVCHKTLAAFPEPKEPQTQVVGAVSAVRGRVQSLVLFGRNEMLRAWFEPMLKGHSFAAAAIELRAKKAGIPLPGKDDPEATLAAVQEQAEKLLARLPLAKFKEDKLDSDELGEALLFRTSDGTRGRAVGLDGRLVRLVVFPNDPFERALYARSLNPPDPDTMSDPEREGVAELARRAATEGQRLTEAEKRLLERLRRGYGQGSGNLPGLPRPGSGGVGPRR